MRRKIKSQKGETLIETLVSVLIAVISVMMLSSSILFCANLNKMNKDSDQKFKKDLHVAECYEDSSEYPKKTVKVKMEFNPTPADPATMETVLIDVNRYGGDSGIFVSYR